MSQPTEDRRPNILLLNYPISAACAPSRASLLTQART